MFLTKVDFSNSPEVFLDDHLRLDIDSNQSFFDDDLLKNRSFLRVC